MILDESDITLVLNPKYQKFLEFDNKKQKIKIVDKRYWDEEKKKRVRLNLPDDIPEELKLFVVQVKNEEKKRDYEPEHHYLIDTKKYFFLFIETFFKIIESGELILPEGLLPLSTKFSPCEVCKNTSHVITRFVRCRHDQDCQEHKKKLEDSKYEETCDCANFTSPCLSLSKIGIVLHLKFSDEEGSLMLDVDISLGLVDIF